jgi:hypothetical protein
MLHARCKPLQPFSAACCSAVTAASIVVLQGMSSSRRTCAAHRSPTCSSTRTRTTRTPQVRSRHCDSGGERRARARVLARALLARIHACVRLACALAVVSLVRHSHAHRLPWATGWVIGRHRLQTYILRAYCGLRLAAATGSPRCGHAVGRDTGGGKARRDHVLAPVRR